jgi:Raf kinase inhibitor-like YbhB/YbcL family protein
MKTAYGLVGISLIALVAGAFYLSSQKFNSQSPKFMLTLLSSAFNEGENIPSRYTCDADNISPPLTIQGVPEGTKMLVLTVDDPDVPTALRPDGMFDHWVLYSIPAETASIGEGSILGNAGLNGRGNGAYTGPCPPPDYEPSTHRYYFRLYAVDTMINFVKIPSKNDVLSAIEGHILEKAELMGTYKRTTK